MKETEVGKAAVLLLRSLGWDVFQEVSTPQGCFDIVATRGPLVAVVECKIVLSWAEIHQALSALPIAHQVFVAVASRGNLEPLAVGLLASRGVGVIEMVDRDWHPRGEAAVYLREAARTRARVDGGPLRRALLPEHRTHAEAGSAGVERWTAFKSAVRSVSRYVHENPGATLADVVEGVAVRADWPASMSARRTSIAGWLRRELVPGVRVERERDGKRIRLKVYPEKTKERRA